MTITESEPGPIPRNQSGWQKLLSSKRSSKKEEFLASYDIELETVERAEMG
jgi:hypothetical protein